MSEFHDLTAAWVLGALDPDEHAAFASRLESDADLRAEVAAQREVLGLIAEGVPQRAAPSHLRDRIMKEARSMPPAPAEPQPQTDVVPIERARRLPWGVAAAAAVAALALGLSNQQLLDRARTAETRVDEFSELLAATEVQVAQRDSLLGSLLGPDIRTATLASTGVEPSARLFWNGATGEVVVTAFSLPPAADGRVYQLWGIGSGADPVSLGTFQTTAAGTAVVRATAPVGASFDVSAITEEPEGGSPQPTQTPFLVGSWAGD